MRHADGFKSACISQVTVLEGGQRVGGRACTVDGKEMGGTYFHGIYGHPLYEYAFKHGIVGAPFTKGSHNY